MTIGFFLAEDDSGTRRLFQLADGSCFELETTAEDQDKPLGEYDANYNELVGKMAKTRKPTKRLAAIPFDTPKNHHAIALYTSAVLRGFHQLRHSVQTQLRSRVHKAFNPDQPRDEHGRWEGGGNPVHDKPSSETAGSPRAASWAQQGKDAGLVSTLAATDPHANAVVYHGTVEGHKDEGFLFVTTSQSGAAYHGKVTAYNIKPGAKLYPDIEGGLKETGHGTLFKPKYGGSSGIIHRSDLVPTATAKGDLAKATREELLAEAQAIADSLDLSVLQVIVEELSQIGVDVSSDAGILAIAQFGMQDNSQLVDQIDTRATEWASDRAAELVGMRYNAAGDLIESANAAMRIDEATRDMLRATIAEGLEMGDRIDEIAADIGDLYAFSEERAALIANTEVRRAQSQGALEGYRDVEALGVEMFKIWIVADSPCEICEPNGEEGAIPLEENFNSGDDAPPAHPHCRCVIAPVVDPDAFESEINPEEDMGYYAVAKRRTD